MARLAEGTTFFEPDGSLTLVLLVSGLWLMMVPKLPLVLAILPRSPVFSSIQQTTVPSGICPTGRMLPIWRTAGNEKNENHYNIEVKIGLRHSMGTT